jgi:hypothetical protein
VLVLTCRRFLVRLLDRFTLQDAAHAPAMLAAMTEGLKQARTPLEVASSLARAAERTLQAPAHAYLRKQTGLVAVGGGHEPPPHESVVGVLVEGAREPCFVSSRHRHSYYNLLTRQDREWIDREGVEVIVPVLSGRNGAGLLGIVTLKGRTNALAYSQDDMRFLRAVAASASLACDALVSESLAGDERSTALEELAVECTECGRVEAWTAELGVCACGGSRRPSVLPKRVLSRFDLSRRLGAGGMGVVYRATDVTLRREVALKTLPRLKEEAAEHLMDEARTMAGLSHSNLAVLYGAERWRGTPLLIMEYLAGGTLADRLRKGPLPETEAIRIVRVLCESLEYVHRVGLYHGDIKPSNIGFTADGLPKFLDFGLSRAVAEVTSDERDGMVLPGHSRFGGTPAYLSPEVRDGARPGPGLDLWALSLVLCESLLGAHPFPAARTKEDIATQTLAALTQLHHAVSAPLRDLLERSLALRSERRPQSVIELKMAL